MIRDYFRFNHLIRSDEMDKLYQTMEQASSKIHWMKEALDEWTTAMARGEETNKLIEKYCQEDRKRAEVKICSSGLEPLG